MNASVKCPICLNMHGGTCVQILTNADTARFDCEICGPFTLTGSVYSGKLDPERSKLTTLERAALSHRVKQTTNHSNASPTISTDWLRHFLEDARLPSPATQAINALRFIGDQILRTGEKVSSLQPQLYAVIGAPNPTLAGELLLELHHQSLVDGVVRSAINIPPDLLDVNLTLRGWQQYEAEKQGKFGGRYGFLAMKFGDEALEALVAETIKPVLKREIGFDVFDMRDVARAGIIDNLMRAQIRDSAFVVVDLTHDNSGAYWEAGYAEGLGKPVIYICEKAKFDTAKTHFDTNHCTTVPWSLDDTSSFSVQLVATLRRSLNLFT